MSRALLREKIRERVADGMSADEVADAVLKLFHVTGEDVIEHETTMLGDAFEQYVWSRVLVCHLLLETGSYQGRPVHG